MKGLSGTFNSGNATAEVFVFLDAPLDTGSHIFRTQPGGNSIALVSEATGTISETTNTPILSYAIPSSGSLNIDLSSYRIVVSPGSIISLAIKASNVTATNSSLIWEVD